jgi:DNA-directed RNA polymerase subunit F
MPRSDNKAAEEIVAGLQSLIEKARAAKLDFTTQLLQIAQLDILMALHDIAPEELDELRAALERQSQSGRVLDLEELRRLRRLRTLRTP